jgi:hypothetical protein
VLSLLLPALATLSACVGVIFHDVLFATLYTCVQRRERAEREYVVVLVWEIRERPLHHKEYKVVILPLATSATPTSGALSLAYTRAGCHRGAKSETAEVQFALLRTS